MYQHERQESKYQPTDTNSDVPILDGLPSTYYMAMSQYLSERGLSYMTARSNGWTMCDRNGRRVYIPARSLIEGHVYWQARGIDGQELRYDSPRGPRRDALVVVESGYTPKVLGVVEGPMDALAVGEIPGCTGIALMGISPSEETIQHLLTYVKAYAIILFIADRDQIHGMFDVQTKVLLKAQLMGLDTFYGGSLLTLDKKDFACYTHTERNTMLLHGLSRDSNREV